MSSEIKLRSVTTPGYSYTLRWCLSHKQISEHEIEQGKIMEEPWHPCVSCSITHLVPCSITHLVSCFPFLNPIPNPKPWTPFCSTLHQISLVLFLFPIIVSDPMPIFHDPDIFSSILICSELHVCFLSLKSTVMSWDGDWECTEVLDVQWGLGFSLLYVLCH